MRESKHSSDLDEGFLPKEDTLLDRGQDEITEDGYSPPDHPIAVDSYGVTLAEERHGEPLEIRLAHEEPDVLRPDEVDRRPAEEAAMHVIGE